MNWIISDIHGCFYTLEKLIDRVCKIDDQPQWIFVGDYVDRGKNSKEVIDFVLHLQQNGAVCLRGNHDDVVGWLLNSYSETELREFVRGPVNISSVSRWWFLNGLITTLQSYGVDFTFDIDRLIDSFRDSVPESHKNFFNSLKLYWENDTHFACHGYLSPDMELPRSLAFLPHSTVTDMLWSRFPAKYTTNHGQITGTGLLCSFTRWDKIGVFGHSLVSSYGSVAPIKHGKIRLIDTGAFMNEYLTAYCCQQDNWVLQATDSRDLF